MHAVGALRWPTSTFPSPIRLRDQPRRLQLTDVKLRKLFARSNRESCQRGIHYRSGKERIFGRLAAEARESVKESVPVDQVPPGGNALGTSWWNLYMVQ